MVFWSVGSAQTVVWRPPDTWQAPWSKHRFSQPLWPGFSGARPFVLVRSAHFYSLQAGRSDIWNSILPRVFHVFARALISSPPRNRTSRGGSHQRPARRCYSKKPAALGQWRYLTSPKSSTPTSGDVGQRRLIPSTLDLRPRPSCAQVPLASGTLRSIMEGSAARVPRATSSVIDERAGRARTQPWARSARPHASANSAAAAAPQAHCTRGPLGDSRAPSARPMPPPAARPARCPTTSVRSPPTPR